MSTFTVLYNCHTSHSQSFSLSHTGTVPGTLTPRPPLGPRTPLCSVSVNLPILGTVCKWDHIIFVLLLHLA